MWKGGAGPAAEGQRTVPSGTREAAPHRQCCPFPNKSRTKAILFVLCQCSYALPDGTRRLGDQDISSNPSTGPSRAGPPRGPARRSLGGSRARPHHATPPYCIYITTDARGARARIQGRSRCSAPSFRGRLTRRIARQFVCGSACTHTAHAHRTRTRPTDPLSSTRACPRPTMPTRTNTIVAAVRTRRTRRHAHASEPPLPTSPAACVWRRVAIRPAPRPTPPHARASPPRHIGVEGARAMQHRTRQ